MKKRWVPKAENGLNTNRLHEKQGTWRMTNDLVISGTAFKLNGKVYIDQGDGNIVLVDDSDHVIYPLEYTSTFDGSLSNFTNTINAMTGGIANRFDITQNARAIYDTIQFARGKMSRDDWQDSLVYGNNGIVSDEFAENHPIYSTIINTGGAILPYATAATKLYRGISTTNKALDALGNNAKVNKFISELDWSPGSWFGTRNPLTYDIEDVESLARHVPEYHEIERTTKANGTWLKMPDGSTWEGDPRSWVLLLSKDALKFSKDVWWHGDDITFLKDGVNVTPTENGTRLLWGNSNPTVARSYTLGDERLLPLVLLKNKAPLKQIDANKSLWRWAYEKDGTRYDTNTFSRDFLKDGEYLRIDNVIDPGPSISMLNSKFYKSAQPNESVVDYNKRVFLGDDVIIGLNTSRKSILGNNGNFDLKNPNIYKSLIPISTVSYVSGYNNK